MSALTQHLITQYDHPILSQRLPAEKHAAEDWYKGDSDLEGQGVFAGRDFEVGETIGLAMTNGGTDEWGSKIFNLTELARYCNHQDDNNVVVKDVNGNFELVASKPISQDDELDSSYYQVSQAIGPKSRMMWEGKDVPSAEFDDYKQRESR